MHSKETKVDDKPVLVSDSQEITRIGLKFFLQTNSSYKNIKETKNGIESLIYILKFRPNIVFIDVDLLKISGLEVINKIKNKNFSTKFIIFTNNISQSDYNKALHYKVHGILSKKASFNEVLLCLEKIRLGNQFISLILQKKNDLDIEFGSSKNYTGINLLTDHERVVLKLISKQFTTKEMANRLNRSPRTIENIRYRIGKKLKISGHNGLYYYIMNHKEFFEDFI